MKEAVMLIGVSSQNFKTITAHAGKTRRFLVFDVDADKAVHEVERFEFPKTMSIHETSPSTPHPLDDLDVLIVGGGGDGFVRKMASRNVQVVLTGAKDPLDAVKRFVAGEQLPPPEPDHHHHRHGHGHGHGHHHAHQHAPCTCDG
jgi:predicted Fe-Mo cluster-binding NifX family protein